MVNDTLKGQLDLELHSGRTIDGVTARIAQRVADVLMVVCDGLTGLPDAITTGRLPAAR